MLDPPALERELRAARASTGGPVAVELLLPFARRGHWRAARLASAVVTFWGRPRRRLPGVWIHRCGSVAEAAAARAAGADAVIVQGVEAGGHLRGTTRREDLLREARATLGAGYPVLAEGGIADAGDVSGALASGAAAAVLGTRFLMTAESGAHTAFKQRLQEARETVVCELFALGWPGRAQVLWNEAAELWLADGVRGPLAGRVVAAVASPALARATLDMLRRLAARQDPWRPLFTPLPPTRSRPRPPLDAAALPAGAGVARAYDLAPAGELTRRLAGR
jgi:nitronate monooxygenase